MPDPADRPSVNSRSLGQQVRMPMAISAEPIMLNGEQMSPGRAVLASSGVVGDRCTAIHKVLRSVAMNTPVEHGCDIITDMIRNGQPVELSVQEMHQAMVEPLGNADDTCNVFNTQL